MKIKVLAALAAVAIAACNRTPVQRPMAAPLRLNGHTVVVSNHGPRGLVVTPWKEATPVNLAKGARVIMPRSGGPLRWELTISDPENGKVLHQAVYEPGAPRTLIVDERGVRVRGHESGDKNRRAVTTKP